MATQDVQLNHPQGKYETGEHADSRHIVAYRVSTSFFGRGFYVAFFMGSEQRTKERLDREGQVRSFSAILFSWISLAWLIFWISALLIGVFIIAGYLIKSLAGIDLMDSNFFLHSFFFD